MSDSFSDHIIWAFWINVSLTDNCLEIRLVCIGNLGNLGKGSPEIPDPKIKPLSHRDNLDNGRIKKASSWTPNALTSTKKFWSQLPQ